MTSTVYFVGAGLSKALQLDASHPIPLLADFVKVAAYYAENDTSNIPILTLMGLERCGRFRWRSEEGLRVARAFEPKKRDNSLVKSFVEILRRRPSESIEDLLVREDRGASFGESTIFEPVIRFRYAISRIFALIGWRARIDLLSRLFARQFAEIAGKHTFVSFNYDLLLDRAISINVPAWHWHCGYGFPIEYSVTEDPTDHGVDALMHPRHACQSNIRILKPHGSLNWLLPVEHRAAAMPFVEGPATARIDTTGRPEYVGNVHDNFPRVDLPERWPPVEVEPGIIPPLRRKDATLSTFRHIRDEEVAAVKTADDVFVLGWSLPATDDDQRCLIRYAASLREQPLKRVVVVNLNQPPEYFERVADTLGVESSSVETWNNGFEDYVEAHAG